MSKKEIQEVMKELMDKYTYCKEEWVKFNHTEKGFDKWFFSKVLKG